MLQYDEEQKARSDAFDAATASGELADGLAELNKFVAMGHTTLAEVGAFGEEELAGGYAAAAAHVEGGQPIKALKIVGTLLTLNPRSGKYYRLAGIALHHLKQYELADGYYDIALAFEPHDAVTMLYRGEVHLHLEQRASGRTLLMQGLTEAADHSELGAIAQRARAIAKVFGISV